MRARRLCPRAMRACGQDARAPRRAGKTPAHPGGRDARAPRRAGGGDACAFVRGRRAACGRDACAPRAACGRDACAPRGYAGAMPAHPGVWAEEMPAPQAGGRRRCLRIRDGAALRAGETSAPLAYKGRFLASPCVRSPISVVRTPKLPLLPVWEKGVGGMRGKGARECRTLLISPKNSTLASRGVRGKSAPECRKSRISFKKSTLESAYPGAVRAGRPRPQTSVRAGRLRPQATSCSIVI